MPTPLVIAIDGPAGAGKSTVAQKVAAGLGLTYVDSGATYRAAALKVLQSAISPDDEQAVTQLISETDIRVSTEGLQSLVLMDGQDVTEKIRTPEVTLAAAKVSRCRRCARNLWRCRGVSPKVVGLLWKGATLAPWSSPMPR